MLEILKDSHPTLKKKSEEISLDELGELSSLLDDMENTMLANGGIGLAAVQVGVLKRVFIMQDPTDKKIYTCINPEIIEHINSKNKMQEGCLSYPGLILKVPRNDKIVVKYTTRKGITKTDILEGIMAQCFQHELDHLNGITFDTKVSALHLKMQQKKRDKLLDH